MSKGKMNWAGLLDYTVQPADMELFQTYLADYDKDLLTGGRSKGIIYGGRLSLVSGLQVQISAGLALMPDGTLVSFPQTNVTLSSADPSNPRKDRIELHYVATNNTNVLDVNSVSKVLDIVYTPSFPVLVGTPAGSPTVPVITSTNISIGVVTVPAAALSLLIGNLSQLDGDHFLSSYLQLGNKNGFIRNNQSGAALEFSTDGVTWRAFGSGGGGGGGANWQPVGGASPVEAYDYNEKVFQFEMSALQALELWVKAPGSYIAGSPITMKLSHYSPGATNNFKFRTTATLIKKGVDAITSVTNQHASINGDHLNTISNLYVEVDYDLTDGSGLINGTFVGPGDLIKVQIQRIAPSGAEDTNDVRAIPSSTEVKFS